MLLRRSGHRRAGLSLIEMMVVVAIISVLVSLLLAGVVRVTEAGKKQDTSTRISGISQAINTFKSQKNVNYIPAGRVDNAPKLLDGSDNPNYGQVVGLFQLRRNYPLTPAPGQPGMNSFEAQYIKQVFPDANLADLGAGLPTAPGFPSGCDLDANQTLLFFLNGVWIQTPNGPSFQGFSKNPRRPFDLSPGDENRHPPLLNLSTQHVLMAPNGYPWLVDGWGNPMAYFSAFNGKEPPSTAPLRYGGAVTNTSYVTSEGVAMGAPAGPYTNGGKPVNPSGFQIISAGKDGLFGPGGLWSGALAKEGQDDRANFSTSDLGGGPEQ